MKQITVGQIQYYWHKNTGTLYYDENGDKQVPIAYFNNVLYLEFLEQIKDSTPAPATPVNDKQEQTGEGFTKGEWEAKQITKKQIIIGIKGYGEGDNYRKDNRCGQIAQIHGWNGDMSSELSGEDLANARLIAAAPAMYEALKELTAAIELISGNNEYPFKGKIETAKAILNNI